MSRVRGTSPVWLTGDCRLLDVRSGANLSSMMLASIDRSDQAPLHDQVAAQIRRVIADGEARAGELFPAYQDLAGGVS